MKKKRKIKTAIGLAEVLKCESLSNGYRKRVSSGETAHIAYF